MANRKQVGRSRREWIKWTAIPLAACIAAGSLAGGITLERANAAYIESVDQQLTLKLKQLKIVLDGKQLQLPGALTSDGQTYVGLRALSKDLGFKLGWDSASKAVTISSSGKLLSMSAGSMLYNHNGQEIVGSPPVVVKGQTYVPLRMILEQMGYKVTYRAAAGQIEATHIDENKLVLNNYNIDHSAKSKQFTIQYPQLSGLESEAAQAAINQTLKQQALDFETAGKEMYASVADWDLPEDTELSYDVNYVVHYNQNGLLSLSFDFYQYAGGAHGSYGKASYTFDLQTGKALTMQEAAKGNPQYKKIINEFIKQQIKERDYYLLEPFTSISDDQGFYIKDNVLVVYFSLYEYVPYALGMPEFAIPLSKF